MGVRQTIGVEASPGGVSRGIANSFFPDFFLLLFRAVPFRRIIKISDARLRRIVLDFGERAITPVPAGYDFEHSGRRRRRQRGGSLLFWFPQTVVAARLDTQES